MLRKTHYLDELRSQIQKGAPMSSMKTIDRGQKIDNPILTLWSCARCGSFVSIESVQPVHAAACPTCQRTPLNLRGNFEDILNMPREDDSCSDYYLDGF